MSEKQLILQTPRSEKEGKEMFQAWSRYFPAVHGQDHAGADIHTADHGEPYTTAGVHGLKEVAGCGVPTLEQAPHRYQGLWKTLILDQSYSEGV